MGKNGYLEKRQAAINIWRQAEKDTILQYAIDIFLIVLNDPEVMGKGVIGKERMRKIMTAFGTTYDDYNDAIHGGVEADYAQEKLDDRLRAFLGDDLIPFHQRYEWIRKETYNKRGGR